MRAGADQGHPDDPVLTSQLRSHLLSRMSHELRTPLNAILGFAQLLQDADLRGEHAHNLKMIIQAGRHLTGLVDDLMDVADIGAGRYPVSHGRVGVPEVVAESAELVRLTAHGRGVTVTVDGGPPAEVVADRRRFVQVLVHLIDNAVRYNAPGGQVRIGWAPLPDAPATEPPAGEPSVAEPSAGEPAAEAPAGEPAAEAPAGDGAEWLRISVHDTGYGIPAEAIHRVFLPFDRLGIADTDNQGTGIGLALSRALVETMGGRIGVRSVPGAGSTFHVDLRSAPPPRYAGSDHRRPGGSAPSRSAPSGSAPSGSAPSGSADGPPRVPAPRTASDPMPPPTPLPTPVPASAAGPGAVAAADPGAGAAAADPGAAVADRAGVGVVLYVEDTAATRTLMRRIFARRPGLPLLTASDPDRGLDLLRRRRPDLILLDLHLPDRADGARMLRAIRADADPVLRATPVVMVTADLTAGTERELLAAGASGFVGKPVDVPALLAAVDEHLGRH